MVPIFTGITISDRHLIHSKLQRCECGPYIVLQKFSVWADWILFTSEATKEAKRPTFQLQVATCYPIAAKWQWLPLRSSLVEYG